ncbi:hypothetical protein ASPTUDRAFT_449884 [Aspergillus tubingensis CBS 134.48]|uniref:Uncharacterized protein n=1 Tax=Aspergillus tubingensis (strain CBS 134.48) TaxID=767770 RepID=A0A1L9NA25_ASPTC|nr:hypothetical protein ASPTUDRAFT_449884 [Aspergillus tubingensis CBS 134.48]
MTFSESPDAGPGNFQYSSARVLLLLTCTSNLELASGWLAATIVLFARFSLQLQGFGRSRITNEKPGRRDRTSIETSSPPTHCREIPYKQQIGVSGLASCSRSLSLSSLSALLLGLLSV